MCLCGGIVETTVAVAVIGGIVAKRKRIATLTMPTLAEMVSKVRSGIRPGQVFKDKRRKARVNEKAEVKRDAETDR